MHKRILKLCILTILTLFHAILSSESRGDAHKNSYPKRIIIDTDMDTDCDDAGALAMLHALADKREAHILATIVSSRYTWSAPCVEAINRYRGRPDLPIGVPKGEGASTIRGSRYARQIADEFPGLLRTNDDAASASEIYRRVLSTAPDRSVTIVTIGYLTNLSDLLATKADSISPLQGSELIRQKVVRLVCMGGRYPEHLDPRIFGNFKPDPVAALNVVHDWPGTIYFSGLGQKVLTGSALKNTPQDNPVRRAYELFFAQEPPPRNFLKRAYKQLIGNKNERPSWDQIAVLFAVRPEAPYWKLHDTGYNHIFENGTNQWLDAPDKDHILIEFEKGVRRRVQETIENLMATPPKTSQP